MGYTLPHPEDRVRSQRCRNRISPTHLVGRSFGAGGRLRAGGRPRRLHEDHFASARRCPRPPAGNGNLTAWDLLIYSRAAPPEMRVLLLLP
jgi:hypothetical protein